MLNTTQQLETSRPWKTAERNRQLRAIATDSTASDDDTVEMPYIPDRYQTVTWQSRSGPAHPQTTHSPSGDTATFYAYPWQGSIKVRQQAPVVTSQTNKFMSCSEQETTVEPSSDVPIEETGLLCIRLPVSMSFMSRE
jgi:hypothetical protein